MAIQVFPGQGGMTVRSFPQGYGPQPTPRTYAAPQQQVFTQRMPQPGGFTQPTNYQAHGISQAGTVNPGQRPQLGGYDPGGMTYKAPDRGTATPQNATPGLSFLPGGIQPITQPRPIPSGMDTGLITGGVGGRGPIDNNAIPDWDRGSPLITAPPRMANTDYFTQGVGGRGAMDPNAIPNWNAARNPLDVYNAPARPAPTSAQLTAPNQPASNINTLLAGANISTARRPLDTSNGSFAGRPAVNSGATMLGSSNTMPVLLQQPTQGTPMLQAPTNRNTQYGPNRGF